MNLGRISAVRPLVTTPVAIFTARRHLEALLAKNRIPGRVEFGSLKDHLQIWAHSSADVAKIHKLLKADPIAGHTFEGFQVLVLAA